MSQNTKGSGNIALGPLAGSLLTTGSNNIDISNDGTADEAGTIRLGTEGTQTRAFLAGIWGKPILPALCNVKVNHEGQLGCSEKEFGEEQAARGATGATGPSGAEGKVGAQGKKGTTGATGPTGPTVVTREVAPYATSGDHPAPGTIIGPVKASCPSNKTLVGGGAEITHTGRTRGAVMVSSPSAVTLGGAWTATGVVIVRGGRGGNTAITAYALCAG